MGEPTRPGTLKEAVEMLMTLNNDLKLVLAEKATLSETVENLQKLLPLANNTAMIVDSSQSLPLPIFDPSKISPQSFINELEEYFTWKSCPQNTWLHLLARVFAKNTDVRFWWRESKSSCTEWNDFKVKFIKYHKSGANSDLLIQQLFLTKQKFSEAFETYCWKIKLQYTQIEPEARVTSIIERIINSCLPEISAHLRQTHCTSVIDLIIKGREIIFDLNKKRAAINQPLLRAKEADPPNYQPKSKPFQNGKKFYNSERSSSNSSSSSSQGSPEGQHSDPSASSSATSSNPQKAESSQSPQRKDKCAYCKRLGHSITECYKRQRAEARKSQANSGSGN